MTTYLLKASLSLLLAFGFYKIWLENERMHGFKRFYLLGSLLFATLVPLVSLEVGPVAEAIPLLNTQPEYQPAPALTAALPEVSALKAAPAPAASIPASTSTYWLGLYAFVTALLLSRFGRNLYQLARQVADHPKQPFRGATLVRLPTGGLPYTFLHYLFVPEAAYRREEIEAELFTHELAHIRQRHSLDVLLLELLLCLGWFNPVLYWYKRAMQLNHEFLADEAVNRRHQNVPGYQYLLLSKLVPVPFPSLASTLTFQTTKQRLFMMTKHTSRARLWLSGSSAALLLGTLTVLLGATAAQVAPPVSETTVPPKPQPQANEATGRQVSETKEEMINRLYGDKLITLPGGKQKRYRDLSVEEKKFVYYFPLEPRRTPTEAQWTAWHNPKMYGIWVDGKRLRGNALRAYQRTDIVAFSGSYVHKNARQPEGYLYQMDLTTNREYEDEVKRHEESPFVVVVKFQPKAKFIQPRRKQSK